MPVQKAGAGRRGGSLPAPAARHTFLGQQGEGVPGAGIAHHPEACIQSARHSPAPPRRRGCLPGGSRRTAALVRSSPPWRSQAPHQRSATTATAAEGVVEAGVRARTSRRTAWPWRRRWSDPSAGRRSGNRASPPNGAGRDHSDAAVPSARRHPPERPAAAPAGQPGRATRPQHGGHAQARAHRQQRQRSRRLGSRARARP